jgi:hypothetical protein
MPRVDFNACRYSLRAMAVAPGSRRLDPGHPGSIDRPGRLIGLRTPSNPALDPANDTGANELTGRMGAGANELAQGADDVSSRPPMNVSADLTRSSGAVRGNPNRLRTSSPESEDVFHLRYDDNNEAIGLGILDNPDHQGRAGSCAPSGQPAQ